MRIIYEEGDEVRLPEWAAVYGGMVRSYGNLSPAGWTLVEFVFHEKRTHAMFRSADLLPLIPLEESRDN